MKNILIICIILPLLLSSCNKKLKEDMKEMEREIENQKNINASLQNQLGADEPITATTTFADDSNVTRTVSATYGFKASNGETQYMSLQSNGTYEILIQRFLDLDDNEGAWMMFYYNPSTGAITNPGMGHYWDWNISGYYSYAQYYLFYTPVPAINITIHSINTSTGYIDLTATGTASDGYNGTTPNSGKGATTTLSFKGTLGIMNNTF
jgi:hypothetical protein